MYALLKKKNTGFRLQSAHTLYRLYNILIIIYILIVIILYIG